MATRLQRYEEKVKALEAKRASMLRSGDFLGSMNLNVEIMDLKKQIEEMRPYYEPRPLSESVSPEELKEMNIIPLMIECHLIADLLTEVCYMVKDTIKKHGFDNVSFMPELTEILKRTDKFASFLASVSPELCELLTRNETFNKSLHKKFLNHIDQRLNQFRKQKAV